MLLKQKTMVKQHDIIIVGIQPWDITIGSNCKNMALELSKKHRVLYVNSPLDRSTARKKDAFVQKRLDVINGKIEPLTKINENLWEFNPPVMIESINLLPNFLFSLANKYNNKKIANSILKALTKLDFKEYYILNDSDMFRSFYLKEFLNPVKYIYYTRDNLMTVPYWKKHGAALEPKLMKKADIILGNSPFLIQTAKKVNSNSHYIGQGCDIEAFSSSKDVAKPNDLSKLKGKIVGYTGLLSDRRLDIDLIEKVALSHPEWNIVLIGPEEENFKKSNLHILENCFFLGNKTPESLPDYIYFFDVCINPQIVNDLTIANYPRKIDEYLAMGKPVVATYTPTMEIFSKHSFLAHSSQEFIRMIEFALNNDDVLIQNERKQFARSHSWENCINNFWVAIENGV
jgi:glycosyltransferase involved in cell wall biosynthesis